jgi:predicted nucleic acid-binding protein
VGWNAEEQTATIAALGDAGTVVVPTEKITAITSGPSDNRILEAAVAAHPDYVVSGDSDLLNPHVFGGIEIVTPARFAAILQGI